MSSYFYVFLFVALWLTTPTLAQLPAVAPALVAAPLPTITFSSPPGYHDTLVTLELWSPGTAIYYTTNGDRPRATRAHRYTQPLRLERTTVIKALAVSETGSAPVVSATYFIQEPATTLPTVSLSLPADWLFDPAYGLFMKGKSVTDSIWSKPGANFWTKREYPMHTEIFDPAGERVFASRTGFRLFGGMSRLFPQKSLTVVARKRYGKKRIDYPVFGAEGDDKYKFLVLRNSGSDFGKSQFRDAYMTTLVKDWDLDVQAYQPTQVYLNGDYWGLYNFREKINRYYVARHHDLHPDSLDLIEHRYAVKRGSRDHYLRMLNFVERHPLSNAAHYRTLGKQMELSNFMDYQIAQIFFNNRDAGGNIKFFRPQTEDGRWRWILYDTDWGFGLHDAEGYAHNSLEFHTAADGPNWPNPPWSTFLLRHLLENSEFRRDFVNRFCDRLSTDLTAANTTGLLDRFVAQYRHELPRHRERWRRSERVWDKEIDKMRTFGEERPAYVRGFLEEKFNTGVPRHLTVHSTEGGSVTLNRLRVATDADTLTGTYYANYPVHLAATARPGYRLVGWEGSATLADEQDFVYALRADSTTLRAVFAPYTHPLVDRVMINEVSCNNRETGDWVELYNATDERVNLGGWQFRDTRHRFDLPAIVLPPKGYLLICQDSAAVRRVHPTIYRAISGLPFGLDKRHENLGLYTADGARVDHTSYRVPPQDSSFTLNLLLPDLDNARADNWELLPGAGTPNFANRYYVESRLTQQRQFYGRLGVGLGVLALCSMLLYLRGRRVL